MGDAARAELSALESDIAVSVDDGVLGSRAEQVHQSLNPHPLATRFANNDRQSLRARLSSGTGITPEEGDEIRSEIRRRRARIGELMGAVETPGAGADQRRTATDAEILSRPPPLTQAQITEIFEFYCNFGRTNAQTYQETMDSFMFMKFARECPGLLEGSVSGYGCVCADEACKHKPLQFIALQQHCGSNGCGSHLCQGEAQRRATHHFQSLP